MQYTVHHSVLLLSIGALFVLGFTNCVSTAVASRSKEPDPAPAATTATPPDEKPPDEEPPNLLPPIEADPVATTFDEIWGYLVADNEVPLRAGLPLSDVVYFGAQVDAYGHLTDVPSVADVKRVRRRFHGKLHFSVTCASAGLTHFVIATGSEAATTLVAELAAACKRFDGLNIDLENIPGRDEAAFLAFLRAIKKALPNGRALSVCVPARTTVTPCYNYAKIAAIVDRVFVMAYDQHWSTSEPGPVASLDWSAKVAKYAIKTIGPEKLVMGCPFYGRAWGNVRTSRALINNTTEHLKRVYEVGASEVERDGGEATFRYDVRVNVIVYYEDMTSLATRDTLYQKLGVKRVGFWRLGQEDSRIWPLLRLNTAAK
jgi:hypothetical protein